jgi:hypothetical protein
MNYVVTAGWFAARKQGSTCESHIARIPALRTEREGKERISRKLVYRMHINKYSHPDDGELDV